MITLIKSPVNKAGLVDGFDGKSRFGDVELGDFLREGVLLDQQRHHVATRKKLHYEVEVLRILREEINSK